MSWIIQYLWLIPALPLLAAALTALLKQRHRKPAAALAILSMVGALGLACVALAFTLQHGGHVEPRQVHNFNWFQFGDTWLQLGWVLDPLTAVMLVMVCFVGLWIFIYSVGYMAHDENFTRFFCFLSLFAAAMLGVVIANNLLLLFICWELVGLTSYLLIGFWYHKPSAAAAAKKAFVTTRIGDLAFLLGMVWLYAQSGTLLFYDGGNGCLEQSKLAALAAQVTSAGMAVSTAISLLIFCGAIGKSGQVPLHVWLPDAMEGPTPVSALIHAATMVAAGVFLVARVYPLMNAHPGGAALQVVAWVGVITAVFAATIAVAQDDIKRILAYSTVSQLGFMMLGLGVGGVAVGMFHLITHAFFKALLFLGAGSVIHGCHEEQDIRRMGGLKKFMPVTFATYAVGMLALSGFPLLFSGFWSKDEILHAAFNWGPSRVPFYLGLFGALLTAFYMTRQVYYVFFGACRLGSQQGEPHESPRVMTVPLMVLAVFAIVLGFLGTPAWPWFEGFLEGHAVEFSLGKLFDGHVLALIGLSSLVVFVGIGVGWWLYSRQPVAQQTDALERLRPDVFALLRRKYFIDEAYERTVIRLNAWWARLCSSLDYWLWNGLVKVVSLIVVGLAWVDRLFDEKVINLGFDETCRKLTQSGGLISRLQNGRVQAYLRIIGVALTVLTLLLIWGCRV
jgi:NADH-quinone oxidoreductase subunit L